MKMGKGYSEEDEGRGGLKKESSWIMYSHPLPKMIIHCMYRKHILIKLKHLIFKKAELDMHRKPLTKPPRPRSLGGARRTGRGQGRNKGKKGHKRPVGGGQSIRIQRALDSSRRDGRTAQQEQRRAQPKPQLTSADPYILVPSAGHTQCT